MSDIVERLRATGGSSEVCSLDFDGLFKEAAAEIERLRSLAGAVSAGPAFAEIVKDLPRQELVQSIPITAATTDIGYTDRLYSGTLRPI